MENSDCSVYRSLSCRPVRVSQRNHEKGRRLLNRGQTSRRQWIRILSRLKTESKANTDCPVLCRCCRKVCSVCGLTQHLQIGDNCALWEFALLGFIRAKGKDFAIVTSHRHCWVVALLISHLPGFSLDPLMPWLGLFDFLNPSSVHIYRTSLNTKWDPALLYSMPNFPCPLSHFRVKQHLPSAACLSGGSLSTLPDRPLLTSGLWLS